MIRRFEGGAKRYGRSRIRSIDGSKFKAVNNRDKNFTRAKMERRLAQIEESVARYLSQLDTADLQEPTEALAAKTAHLTAKWRRTFASIICIAQATDFRGGRLYAKRLDSDEKSGAEQAGCVCILTGSTLVAVRGHSIGWMETMFPRPVARIAVLSSRRCASVRSRQQLIPVRNRFGDHRGEANVLRGHSVGRMETMFPRSVARIAVLSSRRC
jgi:hypothetical protein